MARKPRVEFPGAFYHTIARGNNKQETFRDDQDYRIYISRLKQYEQRYRFILYAYALMPNHIHLIIETGAQPLSKIMQGLQLSYTLYFHKKHSTVGHLFQARYKTILCQRETYLLELVRYIHLNPVRSALVDKPDEYPWTSHLVYSGRLNQSFVKKDDILRMFSEDEFRAQSLYNQFVLDGLDSGHREEFYDVIDQRFLGDPEFVEQIKKRLDSKDEELDARRREDRRFLHDQDIFKNKPLNIILRCVSEVIKVMPEAICGSSRSDKISDARALFAFVCSRYAGINNRALAQFLARDCSSVSNMIRKVETKIHVDCLFSDSIDKIIKLMKA
ncbi:MAG: transposase [Candidatus Aminicenantales bacterium]